MLVDQWNNEISLTVANGIRTYARRGIKVEIADDGNPDKADNDAVYSFNSMIPDNVELPDA